MNLSRKIILLSTSLLLLFGAIIFLLFDFFPAAFFIIYCLFLAAFLIISLLITIVFEQTRAAKNNLPDQSISDQVNPVIFSTKSVFPLEIFPDHYILQEKSLTIVKKKFFFTNEVEMIPIKDIGSVRLFTGPFFVSISILKKIIPQKSIELTTLWRKEGIKLKECLDALILRENNSVSIPESMSLKSKKKLIFEIGREKEVEKEI